MKHLQLLIAFLILISLSCKKDNTIGEKQIKCLPITKTAEYHDDTITYIFNTHYQYNSKLQLDKISIVGNDPEIIRNYELIYNDDGSIYEVNVKMEIDDLYWYKLVLDYNEKNQIISIYKQQMFGETVNWEPINISNHMYLANNLIISELLDIYTKEYYVFDINNNVKTISGYLIDNDNIQFEKSIKYNNYHNPYRNWDINLNIILRNSLSMNLPKSYVVNSYNGIPNDFTYWEASQDYYKLNEHGYPISIGDNIQYTYMTY